MNVFYENPQKTPDFMYPQRVDKNGKTFWLNWSAWIHATRIDSPDSVAFMPEKIAELYPKWVEELKKARQRGLEDYCPIKNVSLHFIYEDTVFELTPSAFSPEYDTRFYFEEIHNLIEKDMQDAGCIFTQYWADLD